MAKTTDSDNNPESVETAYVYTGPKPVADLKMRLAEWLERRGW